MMRKNFFPFQISQVILLAFLLVPIPVFALSGIFQPQVCAGPVPARDQLYVPVLMYHSFQPGKSSRETIDPGKFYQQLSYLKSCGYQTISDADLLGFLSGKGCMPEKPLLITIDDGYLNNYIYAYPVLKQLKMKATIFVIADWVGKTPGHYPHFTWQQAKIMADSGLVSIQSHSFNSHFYVNTMEGLRPMLVGRMFVIGAVESKSQYEQRISRDLGLAKKDIEKNVGKKVTTLSYPYGAFNLITQKIALQEGYKMMMTIRRGVNCQGDDAYTVKRINVPGYFSGRDIVNAIKYWGMINKGIKEASFCLPSL